MTRIGLTWKGKVAADNKAPASQAIPKEGEFQDWLDELVKKTQQQAPKSPPAKPPR